MKKRRIVSFFTAVCVSLLSLPLSPVADSLPDIGISVMAEEITDSGTCGENLTWTLNSEGLLTISGEGEMEDWEYPENVPWYGKSEDVKQVVIEDGVTSIGDLAFPGCYSLTSVTIPDSVTNIGKYAFEYCSSLTSVTIPDGVTYIGSSAFEYCSSLTSVTIPDGVTSIGYSAFEYCSSLTSVTIPDGVTSIGRYAFVHCSSLTDIKVGTGNTKYTDIDGVLFSKDKTLLIQYGAGRTDKSYDIPDSVTSIGYAAFGYCSSLTSVTIPDSVTSIGYSAFSGCSSLTSVTIPDGVTSIGSDAFEDCSSLTSITIPDGVTSIGFGAFSGCSSLTSVTIPDSVTDIGTDAFFSCPNLTIQGYTGSYAQTYAEENNIPFAVLDAPEITDSGTCGETLTWTLDSEGLLTISGEGVMEDWDDSSKVPWYGKREDVKQVVIEDGVTSIGFGAFYYCSSLTSVTIPDSVTSIGDDAFYKCSSLTSVTIPDSVTSIEGYAFYGCSSLTSVTIPDSVTSIGDSVFSDCSSLTSVTIPDSVTSIGYDAFYWCPKLTIHGYNGSYAQTYAEENEIPFAALDAPEIIDSGTCGETLTWTLDSEGLLTISGEGEMTDWTVSSKAPWYGKREDVKQVVIEDGVTSIGSYAFYDCSSLTSVTIPDSVTSIGIDAFSGCSSLTSVTIPDGVTSIGSYAFYKCSSLTSVTIPDSVTSIGSYAFEYCSSLTSVTIPDGVTSIGNLAFCNCSSLTSVTIPDGVTYIGSYAFEYCSSLTSVTIPDGVTYIGICAFYNCSSLTDIKVGTGNTKYTDIDGVLFSKDKTKLIQYGAGRTDKSYDIPDGVTSIGQDAFYKCPSLTSITIPDGVTSIGICAFYNCSSLTSVTIPDGVTSIGEDAFSGCDGMTDIKVGTGNTKYTDIDGVLFSKDKTKLIQYGAGRTDKSYDIPDGVTSIGQDAFYECSSLTSITIPDGVTSIGICAFYNCSSLTSVTIPDSVTSIGYDAFYRCPKLTIHGYNGSYAQTYAEENEIPFAALDAPAETTTTTTATTTTTTTTTTTQPTTTSTTTTTTTTTQPTTTSTTTTTTTTQPTTTSTTTTSTTTATTPSEPQSTTTEIIIPVKELDMYDSVTVVLYGTPGQEFEARFEFSLSDVEDGIEDGYDAPAEAIWEDGTYPFTFTAPWDMNAFAIIITSSDALTYEVSYTEPSKNPVFHIGGDSWGFSNIRKIFGNSYTLIKKHEAKLKEGLNRIEQRTIDDKKLNWKGSCYGMAITSILATYEILNPAEYQEKAVYIHDISEPSSELISLINYYYLLQFTDAVQQEIAKTRTLSEPERINILLKALEDESPTLLCYVGESVGGRDFGGHAVVAYKAETGRFTLNNKSYHVKVHIYDNKTTEYDETYFMYINTSDYSWTIPKEKIHTDRGAHIAYVTDNLGEINSHGYLSGNKESNTESFVAFLSTVYTEDSIRKITLGDDGPEFNSMEEDDIIPLVDFNGETTSNMVRYALRDGTSGYTIMPFKNEPQNASIRYENSLLSAETSNSRSVIFDPSGYIEITGQSTDYSAELLYNDGYHYGDWYNMKISGTGADSIILKMTEEGYILHCDNMKNITVSAENDAFAPSVVFSSRCEDVLIYEIDEETIGIKEDYDQDGKFEAIITTVTFGDINDDATINANDAAVILTESAILGAGGTSNLTTEHLTAADVDANGKMDAADAAKILQYAAYVGSGYKLSLKAFLRDAA